MQRMTVQQYRKLNKINVSKYRNKKVVVDGHTFDSKAEARYYNKLKLREKAGDVLFFRLQPRYRLQDGFEKNGKQTITWQNGKPTHYEVSYTKK